MKFQWSEKGIENIKCILRNEIKQSKRSYTLCESHIPWERKTIDIVKVLMVAKVWKESWIGEIKAIRMVWSVWPDTMFKIRINPVSKPYNITGTNMTDFQCMKIWKVISDVFGKWEGTFRFWT